MYEWHKITSDRLILDIVGHCHLDSSVADIGLLFAEEIECAFSEAENSITCQEIVKLPDLQGIQETPRRMEDLK